MRKNDANKDKRYTIRLTNKDYKLLAKNANHAKLTRSDYLRREINKNRPVVDNQLRTREQQLAALGEDVNRLDRNFGGISNNLNQLTKEIHIYGMKWPELKKVEPTLKSVNGYLKAVLTYMERGVRHGSD